MYPPLRQAEWIKFIGLLIGEEEKANVIFDSIKAEYNTLKQLTAKIEKKPVVFSGELRGSSWLPSHIGYYLFAILFLMFDIETVMLYPWANTW